MILNYRCENFGPFKENAEFSMKPGKVTSRFKENVHEINDKLKVSKVAVIVGENAGGKTSFMKSLDYFKFIITESTNQYAIKQLCNKYNTEEQKFEIELLTENKIYTYILNMDKYSVTKEKLEVRSCNQKKSQNKFVFLNKREETKKNENGNYELIYNIAVNNAYINKEIEKLSSNALEVNQLFINFFYTVGIEIVKPFRDYMINKLIVSLPEDAGYNVYKYMQKNARDLEIIKKDTFLEIFRMVDTSIIGLEIDDEDPFRESNVIRETSDGDRFSMKLVDDSSGVKEFFAWAIQIWEVLYQDKVVFADEIDKVLNSILAVKVINYIKNSKHNGQFIFSTHNILHLNTNIFMKEQIYFVSKDTDTLCSELYSLGDFKEYKYDNPNVYELYLKGVFGGVPNA
ncbi:ATP-binding protein [Clostridium perfringens]|mgnify:CR=1 FL=1|uniref:AAA family ATPase n=1 Tax=Clostridium perfringens TaxID=1502 RepID=UPI00016BD1B2|nr:ATP-binding protein [Clostridium perfringens]EDT26954.1 putative RloA [Clostridium perfringens CPE str. F4969]NGT52890.1 ATP-binding protein [Clostridium perfringens]NGT74121.1 ATP-binding protein [Clostridium perfringens]NGU22752.1 ATP-binding protein [Clostridium perfringens]